ncbi:restriction endonuclease subunit S [Planomicrobium sp. MB-3u-38]|uniref:restriction endonuclease subunit S n=1 Tax=Planomicrobium sp. MB-3u-38 TaxID=2058318 RepID=UPI000C7A9F6A|nr:restriction endonuclease subunit S [Planomicrobium sp. MB-3u-38]PKH10547.1 hypothetical protein CXF70_09185 [Planomicrobium sp. MB-3u-38]
MKAQQLRVSILQNAMQGKLTRQNTNDESVRLLIEEIKKEKNQLIETKYIKPEKALPPISEEEIPYEIPETWRWVRAQEVLDVRDGTHDTPKYVSEGIPLVTSKNLKNGKLVFDNIKYISEEDHNKIEQRSKVDNEDILFAMIGSIGNTVLVKKNRAFSIKNVALFKQYPSKSLYMPFIYYLLSYYEDEIRRKSSGGVQAFVSLTFLRNLIFPLPPVMEQKRIVIEIEKLFKKIDTYAVLEKEIEMLNKSFPYDMEKSILQYAMQGKLVKQGSNEEPVKQLLMKIKEEKARLTKDKVIKKEKVAPPITDLEIPFDIPKSWEWVRLSQVGYVVAGGTPKTGESSYWDENGMLWLTPRDMGQNKQVYISDSQRKISNMGLEKSSAQLIPKGSIVYSSRAPIGHINIVEEDYTTNQGCKSIVPMIYNKFLYYSLIFSTPEIIKRASGTTFKEISGYEFSLTVIALPPLEEQYRIVEKIEMLNKLTSKMENIINQN